MATAVLRAAILAAMLSPALPALGDDPHAVVRGMTISCPGAGRIWASDAMVEAMRELKALGVNWITIHPYARIDGDGTVGMGRMYDDPVWLTRPIREAHALGMKIMIKPHIAYWGSPFEWRGVIAFDEEREWRRFFDSYAAWIERVAELSREADAFVVGTELDRTLHHEGEWRRIVEIVRAKTDAPLTYSAGWDRFEAVPFWDALDAIGIQAYFPLVEHERLPTAAELDRAWAGLIERLERYARQHRRPIVFGELGYNLSAEAAVRPWAYAQGGEHAAEVQQRALTAALKAIEASEHVTGAFLWKWFPDSYRGGNFLKSTPAMREVISSFWTEPSRRTGS
jgi:hypothetical protein